MLSGRNSKNLVFCLALLAIAGCDKIDQSDTNFLKKGVELFSKGEYKEAELELKNAIQKEPGSPESYYYMALLNEKSRNFKAMRVNLQEAVKQDPEYIDARVKLSKVHLLFKDIENALLEVEAVLARQPDKLDALTVKAQVLLNQQKTEDAMGLVDLILTNDPDFIDALALKAVILRGKKSFDDALVVVNHGLDVDEKNVSFHLLKIQLHSAKNDSSAVVKDYQDLLKIQPENDEIKYALARAYVKNEEKKEAEKIIRNLIKDNPNNTRAKLILLNFLSASDKNSAFKQMREFLPASKNSEKIEFAKWALLKKDRIEADNILNEIVANDGGKELVTALYLQASMSYQQKDLEKTTSLIEKILQINPDYVEAKILKAGVLFSKDKNTEAEELLNNVLWEKPDSDSALVLLAIIYQERGEKDKANNNFLEALKINPSNIQALMPVVNKAIKRQHYDYAKELLQRAMLKGGERLDLLQMLVKLNFADKDWDTAEKLIKRIKSKKNGKLLAQLLTAQSLTKQNECSQSIEIYKEILEKHPWQSTALSAMAGCYEQLKKRPKMVKYLDRFIELNQSNIPAYLLKNRLLVLNGKQDQAINLLKKTLGKIGNLSPVYRELAGLYLKKGDMEAALASYQQGLKKFPNDVKLLMALASYYEQKQSLDPAIKLYEQVLTLKPNSNIAKNNLASILVMQGTEKDIEKAVKLTAAFKQSEQPYFLDSYAWAQFKSGNVNDALVALRKVVILAPEVPVFRYHLAEIYHYQQDRSEAIMELRQALELSKKTSFTEEKSARVLLDELLDQR